MITLSQTQKSNWFERKVSNLSAQMKNLKIEK